MSVIQLPTQPVSVETKEPRIMVLYGSPKVGKTGALARIPNNLIIDLEEGTAQVEALKINVSNFNDLGEVGKAIIQANRPYDFVTIDTVSELELWCEQLATQMYKATPQGANFSGNTVLELSHGAGYYWLRLAYGRWLDRFKKLAPRIILVAHLKDKFLSKDGKEVSAKDLDLTGKIKNITCKDADAIGYMYRDPENVKNARITFIHRDELLCGTRCEHLIGQDLVISESDGFKITKTHWDKIYPETIKQ